MSVEITAQVLGVREQGKVSRAESSDLRLFAFSPPYVPDAKVLALPENDADTVESRLSLGGASKHKQGFSGDGRVLQARPGTGRAGCE